MNNINEEQVLPEVNRLERFIKVILVYLALSGFGEIRCRKEITKYVDKFGKTLPSELPDKETYIQFALISAMKIVDKFFSSLSLLEKNKKIAITITQKEDNVITDKEIDKIIKELVETKLETQENGKKPISLRQRIELDIRHLEQEKMVKGAYESGIDLWWLSEHAGCSNRCKPYQGKVVSLTLRSADKSFYVGKNIDSHKIYSFTDIENQVDKYGYKNNIINGFNCRHHMIIYNHEKHVPKEFSSGDCKVSIKKRDKMRRFEDKIRELKVASAVYSNLDNNKSAKYLAKSKKLTNYYKKYAKKHGLAVREYELKT